jgi:phenylacetate-CoA ligase
MSDPRAARLAALMQQLERAEWLAADELVQRQHRQLVALSRYAARHSPHFRSRLDTAGLRPDDLATAEGLRRLPVLRRRDLQQAGESLYCDNVPPGHLPLNETRTSGSTGEPVAIRRTALSNLLWHGVTLRDHRWHGRDFGGRLATIRAILPKPVAQRSWGPPVSLLHRTGPSEAVPITTDIADQAAWLQRFDPDYLIIYPNNLAGLLRHCEQHDLRFPQLRQVRTVGETLPPGLREETTRVLGVGITDVYSSQEIGNIALQCPQSGLYHAMAETVLVEVVDELGRPCAPGETGRIVVTDLFNLATPLVRYDIGDVAEVAGPCACGRGLPTLRRILGRERNLILMPDGRRHWPLVGYYRFREVAPVAQYQLIQHSREEVEVRLVTERGLSAAEELALGEVIRDALGAPFRLAFVYFEGELPRGPGGKFEEFVCRAS